MMSYTTPGPVRQFVPLVTLTIGTVEEGTTLKVGVKMIGAAVVTIVGGSPVAIGKPSVGNVAETSTTTGVAEAGGAVSVSTREVRVKAAALLLLVGAGGAPRLHEPTPSISPTIPIKSLFSCVIIKTSIL